MKTIGKINELIEYLKKQDLSKTYDLSLVEHKEKRTPDQNSYYRMLLDKYAEWMGISKIRMHNMMLESYGQRSGWTAWIPEEIDVLELDDMHLSPTTRIREGDNGLERECHVMRGTHTYNTKEMSILIKGLINDIVGSEAPIPTMSAYELAKIWGN